MGSHANDPTRALLESLRWVVRSLRLSAVEAERRFGLSGAQNFLLQRLGEGPALSVAELAARTFTDPSSASVVVARLVERGLATRRRSPADGRRAEIALTPAGRAVLRRAPKAAQAGLLEAFGRLPPATRRALASGVTRLAREMGFADQAPLFFENERPVSPRTPRARRTPR